MSHEIFLCASTVDKVPMRERIEIAARAGYDGFGFRPGHAQRAVADGYTFAEIQSDIRAHGLEVFELGFLSDWWLPNGENADSIEHERALHRLKRYYGGRHMMTISGPLDDGVDAVAERFAGVCRRAAEYKLKVALEFLPWTDVHTIEQAWEIVEKAGEPNGSVVMDTWHFFRGGSTFDQLRKVPAGRISVIQLSDGPLGDVGDELDATFRRRRIAGEGEFDLAGLFAVLKETGVNAPIGVEVLNDELRALPPEEAAQRALDGTKAFLAQV